MAKQKKEQALENKCPSCTASIKYNPKLEKFKCEYCGSEFTLEDLKKHSNNASTDEKNKPKEEQPKDTFDGYVSYHCESCGAEIVADEQTAATFCVYCKNTAILKSRLTDKFSPSKIIPFSKTKDENLKLEIKAEKDSGLNEYEYFFFSRFANSLICNCLENFVGGYSDNEPKIYKAPKLIFENLLYFLNNMLFHP